MSKNIDYSEKYKKKLDKALNSYGITATDLNVNGFDASKQYTKNDYDVLRGQIQGWEHDHPLRDIDTTQMTFEFNRLLNENFTDPLPARLLQQYKSGKRYRQVKQDKQAGYPDYTAEEMVKKNYRDELKRRADFKKLGRSPTVSRPFPPQYHPDYRKEMKKANMTTGGKRKTRRRRKKKRKTTRRRKTRKKRKGVKKKKTKKRKKRKKRRK